MLLAAAYLSGVDDFYTYGGPQAIISMAVGTKKVSKVDMICGPGNIFVMTAKKACIWRGRIRWNIWAY